MPIPIEIELDEVDVSSQHKSTTIKTDMRAESEREQTDVRFWSAKRAVLVCNFAELQSRKAQATNYLSGERRNELVTDRNRAMSPRDSNDMAPRPARETQPVWDRSISLDDPVLQRPHQQFIQSQRDQTSGMHAEDPFSIGPYTGGFPRPYGTEAMYGLHLREDATARDQNWGMHADEPFSIGPYTGGFPRPYGPEAVYGLHLREDETDYHNSWKQTVQTSLPRQPEGSLDAEQRETEIYQHQTIESSPNTDPRRIAHDRLIMVKAQISQAAPPLPPLFPELSPDDFIHCARATCLDFLGQLLADQSHSRIRCCVHEGCGFMSESTDQWEEHIGTEHHEDSGMREEVQWGDWGEGGRCCA